MMNERIKQVNTGDKGQAVILALHLDICPWGRYQGGRPMSLSGTHQPCNTLYVSWLPETLYQKLPTLQKPSLQGSILQGS